MNDGEADADGQRKHLRYESDRGGEVGMGGSGIIDDLIRFGFAFVFDLCVVGI